MKGLRRFAIMAAALALIGSATAAPANATGGSLAPAISSGDGIVTVCAGVSYNSHTDNVGTPLTKQQVSTLAGHMKYRCAHPNMRKSSSSAHTPNGGKNSGDGVVAPYSEVLGGDLTAFLYMGSDGVTMTYFTSASSMPSGDKTLTCEIQWNYGAWTECGAATSSSSYLSTRTNTICPGPGQHVEVYAWLDYGGAQYSDDAMLNT